MSCVHLKIDRLIACRAARISVWKNVLCGALSDRFHALPIKLRLSKALWSAEFDQRKIIETLSRNSLSNDCWQPTN